MSNAALDIREYLISKGLHLRQAPGDEFHMPCFFCQESGKKSRLYVNCDPSADIPGLFQCHNCNAHGALNTILKHFGDYQPPEVMSDDDYTTRYEILQSAALYYHERLTSPDNPHANDAVRWLVSERGLEPEVIGEHKLGYADGGLRKHLRSSGFSLKAIQATGLVDNLGTDFFGPGVITIPYHNSGNVVHLRGRPLNWQKGQGPKYITPTGIKGRWLFNSDLTWNTEEIYITEGEFDAMLLTQHGMKAVATGGCTNWRDNWSDYMTPMRRVRIVFDQDKDAVIQASKLKERIGAKASIIKMPPVGLDGKVNDPTEWLVHKGHTKEDFLKLAQKADAASSPFIRASTVKLRNLEFYWNHRLPVGKLTIMAGIGGVGKGLALDTPIPTPDGWTQMGDLRNGDQVFDEEGRVCRVINVTPARHLPCFRVKFTDGSSLVTDDQHLWTTIPIRERTLLSNQLHKEGRSVVDWRNCWDMASTINTPALRDTIMSSYGRTGTNRRDRNHLVPTTHPLVLPEVDLTIPPYVLGAWLGDGTAANVQLTCFDQGILDNIVACDWEAHPQKAQGRYGLSPKGKRCARKGSATALLSDLGVVGSKHIPPQYLRASTRQRITLLQGLMDTDGFVIGKSNVGIDLCNQRLALDVAELVRSLGWKVRVRSGPAVCNGTPTGGLRYRLSWRPTMNVFQLSRKRDAWIDCQSQRSRSTGRMVATVEPVASVPTRCIEVDSPRRLYLAGEDMIPTHNSWIALALAASITAGVPLLDDGGQTLDGEVVMLSYEDDLEDTLVPRAERLGVDLDRLHLLSPTIQTPDGERPFGPHDVAEYIEEPLRTNPNIRMVVIDPIGSFYGGNVDGNMENAVRGALASLVRVAAKTNTIVLTVAHHRKGSGGPALHMIAGSQAAGALARSTLTVGEIDGIGMVAHTKHNLSAGASSLTYTVEDGVFRWGAVDSRYSADDLAKAGGATPNYKDKSRLRVAREGFVLPENVTTIGDIMQYLRQHGTPIGDTPSEFKAQLDELSVSYPEVTYETWIDLINWCWAHKKRPKKWSGFMKYLYEAQGDGWISLKRATQDQADW